MPCNAIATATARVSNEELMKHMNMADLLDVLIAHFEEQGHTITHKRNAVDVISFEIDTTSVTVNRSGRVTVRNYGRRRSGKAEQELAQEVQQVVSEAAGIMFQAKMITEISAMLPVLGTETVDTGDGEAVVMNVTLNGLIARVIIMPDGTISVFTDEGTFDAGADGIRQLFDDLGAVVTFESVSQPEQHRHDDDQTTRIHLHRHVYEGGTHQH